jgi:hypothetical protein
MVEEAQQQAKKVGLEYQKAAEAGFEAASHSFGEINRGFRAMAAEMTDFSKRRLEDVMRTWEQVLGARNFGEVIEAQTQYAQRAYDAYMSEMSKVGEMYLGTTRNASKPIEQTSRRLS